MIDSTVTSSTNPQSNSTENNPNSSRLARASVNARAPWLTLRLRQPAWSFKLDRRAPWVLMLTLLVTLAVMIWNVGTGEYPISPLDVIKTVLHIETGNSDFKHLARRLVGPAHEGSLVVTELIGGLLVLADFVGRTVFAPIEVPAGIIIALIGAPFFIILLWQHRGSL